MKEASDIMAHVNVLVREEDNVRWCVGVKKKKKRVFFIFIRGKCDGLCAHKGSVNFGFTNMSSKLFHIYLCFLTSGSSQRLSFYKQILRMEFTARFFSGIQEIPIW